MPNGTPNRRNSLIRLAQNGVKVVPASKAAPLTPEPEKSANNNSKKMMTKEPAPVAVQNPSKLKTKGDNNNKEKPEKATKSQKQEAMASLANVLPITPPGSVVDVHTTYAPFQKLCEMAILDHFQHNYQDFSNSNNITEIIFPAQLKGYLIWAFFDKLRSVGSLITTTTTSDIGSFPEFPNECFLPNSIWYAIQYYMPYEEDGSRSQFKLNVSALPVGNDLRIAQANGAGNILSYPALGLAFISWINEVNSEQCINQAASAATINFGTVSAQAALISDMFQSRGGARQYGELSSKAPDASIYSKVDANTYTVCNHVRKFKPELALALHCDFAGTHDVDMAPCLFKKALVLNTAKNGSREVLFSSEDWAVQCYTFFANRHSYSKVDTAFVPYWAGEKMKSFMVVQRTIDLRGFWQTVIAFAETVFIDLGVNIADDTMFHFLWMMELALAARVYCNSPAIYGRTNLSSSSDFRNDLAAYIGKSACSIKVPPIIAAYIDCFGVFLDENRTPCAFYPQWDTDANSMNSWLRIASVGATNYPTGGLGGQGFVRPFWRTSATPAVSVRGVTWNAANWTAFATATVLAPVWPQRNFDVLSKLIYKDIQKLVGGADIYVGVSDKIELAGRCTSAITYTHVNGLIGISSFTNTTTYQYDKQLICLRIGSPTPLVGTELVKAQLFLYNSDDTTDRTTRAKYQKDCDDPFATRAEVARLIMDTMQLDGSYQQELARRRATSSKKQFLEVPGAGLIPAPLMDVSMQVMDELIAKSTSLLGNVVGDEAADTLIKFGKSAVPALAKKGLGFIGDLLAPGLGSFVFG